jgi:hypothetical protein
MTETAYERRVYKVLNHLGEYSLLYIAALGVIGEIFLASYGRKRDKKNLDSRASTPERKGLDNI